MQQGFRLIAGVDEVGRGPLAGPVVAAAVIMPEDFPLCGVVDSKALTRGQREIAAAEIQSAAVCWSVGVVSAAEIDALNILRATHEAMRRALAALSHPPDFAVIDGLPVPGLPVPSEAVVKGDRLCYSVAAASILAKVHRDALMVELDGRYPGYGFARNMGYASAEHREAIRMRGPCPEHRRSFEPVKSLAQRAFDL
ncbi:MAG: ribonuclease HII [Armatimonadetes bacterium]|nr:ribonuclease HII [Armatimonadota bacterium]